MICVCSNDEFDSTESDELLDDLMPPVYDQEQMDITNQVCTNITNMNVKVVTLTLQVEHVSMNMTVQAMTSS